MNAAPQIGELIVYEDADGEVRIDVRLEHDTVWLTQQQLAALFGRERSVIGKHVRNVFAEGELDEKSNVQNLPIAGSDKPVRFYNLDVIISVGYRVKSLRGTQFRIWATRTLNRHLVRGHTLNAQRLAQRGLNDVQEALALVARTLSNRTLVTDEGAAVLQVVRSYLGSFDLLLAYDEDRLPEAPSHPAPAQTLSLSDARAAIDALRRNLAERGEATALFGEARSEGLAGVLGAIEQTMFGEPLYPSAQSRAAHLLYFIIKDHPFVDGNKRIGTLLFLDYLRRNGLLTRADGSLRFVQNAIVALALLVAESAPPQKDLMIRLTLALME